MSKSHDRAPDQDVLNISLPKSLKAEIKAAAEADDRTMASWVRIQLQKMLDESIVTENTLHQSAAAKAASTENHHQVALYKQRQSAAKKKKLA